MHENALLERAKLLIVLMLLAPALLLGHDEKLAYDQLAYDSDGGHDLVEPAFKGEASQPADGGIAIEGRADGPNLHFRVDDGETTEWIDHQKDIFDDDFANHFVTMTFYDNDRAGGSSFTYWTHNNNTNVWLAGNFPSSWNDRIGSYVLKGGCYLKLYRHYNQSDFMASIDLRNDRSKIVSSTIAAEQASSWEVYCVNNVDAEAIVFTNDNYSGPQLPVWDSWTVTTTSFGDWDTKISSFNVNTADGSGTGLEFEAFNQSNFQGGTKQSGDLWAYWTFQDLGLLPDDLNNHVAGFTGLRNSQPKPCSPRSYCFQPSRSCEGTGFLAPSRYYCHVGFGQSFCNNAGLCVDAEHGYYVPNEL